MFEWLGQLPDGQEISMGWEQDGLEWGGDSAKSVCPVHLVDRYG